MTAKYIQSFQISLIDYTLEPISFHLFVTFGEFIKFKHLKKPIGNFYIGDEWFEKKYLVLKISLHVKSDWLCVSFFTQ